MATISNAYREQVEDWLGSVPSGLSTVISSLTAAQRDNFTRAWVYASDEQRLRPAETWVLPEDERTAFDTFRTAMNGLSF